MTAPRLSSTLRGQRAARGWSQEHLAGLAGISRQSYGAIESGAAVPSTEVALRLARALSSTVEALFRLPDETPADLAARAPRGGAPEGARVRLAMVAGRRFAFPLGAQGTRAAAPADGVAGRSRGREVRVRPLAGALPEPDLVAVGCDPAFGLVADRLRRDRGFEVLWLPRGSRAALRALAEGEAHVAGVHLLDPESGAYNAPWIHRLVPFRCTRVGFALWEQALVVAPGNPLGVRAVTDLARSDVRFLNREPGSGSRAFLEALLGAAGVREDEIPGYARTAAASHAAVAEAVGAGAADAGVAIRAVALAAGVDAVILGVESYDLVIPDHFLDLPAVQALLDLLRDPGLRGQVESLGGYDLEPMGRPA